MKTMLRFGLADHGRLVSAKKLEHADYESGYKYEIIDGRLYVSPEARTPENHLELWLFKKIWNYADLHPEVVNYVSNKARVFIPSRKRTTVPEPDLAAYSDWPVDRPIENLKWEDVSPILVAEVLYASDPYKDLVRNVELFLQVPSVREYWILDGRDSADEPILIVRRRRGRRWVKRVYYYRDKYTTKLLPGFKLVIDPRR